MNIFDSFQPKKQRLGTGAVAKPKQNEAIAASVRPAQPPVSGLKALLLNLDSNPLTLSVSHKDSVNDSESAVDKALKAKLAHIPVRAVQTMQWSEVRSSNLSLYKQITIEANFDLVPLVDSTLAIPDVSCYIYPHSPRLMSENYSLSDFVNRNLSKTRHWTTQQSDLPYFNASILGNIAATSSAGAALMLGGPAAGGSSAGTRSGPADHEAALLTVQSRMLQWQEALFALLRGYLSPTPTIALQRDNISSNIERTPEERVFYVLGRSLLVPANAASSAASSNGKIISLPYTSAVFYYIHTKISSSQTTNTALLPNATTKPVTEAAEPACLLIGVHKSTLSRLQQLGAVCTLLEDLAHPWSHTSNNTSNNNSNNRSGAPAGASAEINVAAVRGTLDPHASTSALLNNKKVGINILVTGQFSVKVAAEVLLESVFAFVHHAGRPASTDVPILMAHSKFAHSMEMIWDKRPIQCDYKFSPRSNLSAVKEEISTHVSSGGKANKDGIKSGYHKVQLQGLITSHALPHVMQYLYQLAQSGYNTPNTTTAPAAAVSYQRKLTVPSAYSYLKHDDTSTHKNTTHTDMRNVPGAVAAPVVPFQARQTPLLPPVNPMVLVTTKARMYAAPKEEEETSEGSDSDDDGDGDGDEEGSVGKIKSGGDSGGGKASENEAGARKSGSDDRKAFLQDDAAANVATSKRKLEPHNGTGELTSTTASKAPTSITTTATAVSGELRAERWLKQRRDNALPYFLIQLSTVAPRCTQLSYAHLAARQSTADFDASQGEGHVGEKHDDFVLLAEPLIEEIRWQANPQSGTQNGANEGARMRNSMNYETVEVVTTTQPTLRTKMLVPAKAKTAVSKASSDHDHDELEENGVLLDALNKYSIFVESKPM